MSAPGPTPLAALEAGGKAALAAALTTIEASADNAATRLLLDTAWLNPRAHVVGLTGPPGVGKSSLADKLIAAWRTAGQTVGVVAVDPSSRRTGGALLGDRTRLTARPGDDGVFIRSLATRGRLGGLSAHAFPAVVLMRALFDRVVVETVGVGQSEADITGAADTVVLCIQPGSGDSLQFMKAGIMEIPDVAVVTKADIGQPARQALSELSGAMSLAAPSDWSIPKLALSSHAGTGVAELISALDAHHNWLIESGTLEDRRQAQGVAWLNDTVTTRIGVMGGELLKSANPGTSPGAPFSSAAALLARVHLTLD